MDTDYMAGLYGEEWRPALDKALGECRACGADIVWARHPSTGKLAPLVPDLLPGEMGGFILQRAGDTILYVAAAKGDELRYVSHFAGCPEAASFRRVTVREHERTVGPRRQNVQEGRKARDEGIARHEEAHQEDPWKAWAPGAIRRLAASGEPFNADELDALREQEGIAPPRSPAAVGAAFRAASTQGVIERTGAMRQAAQASAHARWAALWRGV